MRVLLLLAAACSTQAGRVLPVDENGDPVPFRRVTTNKFFEDDDDDTLPAPAFLEKGSQQASPDDQRGSEEKEKAFLDWLNGPANITGLKNIKITNVGNPPHRGTIALVDIKEGDGFIHVPYSSMILGEDQRIESDLGAVFHHDYQKVKPFFYSTGEPNLHRRVALSLLVEKRKGAKSFYKPYIDILPQHFTRIQDFSDLELAEMEGSTVYKEVIEARARAQYEYEMLFPMLSEAFPKILANVSFAEWHWAKNIIITRCFGVTHHGIDDIALVPLADLPNHNNVAVSWRTDTDGFNMVAKGTSFKTGEEVFISYGRHNNQHLLSVYGFMLPDNKYKVESPCKHTDDECVLDSLKKYPTSVKDDLKLLADKQPSFNTNNAIRLRVEEKRALLDLNDTPAAV